MYLGNFGTTLMKNCVWMKDFIQIVFLLYYVRYLHTENFAIFSEEMTMNRKYSPQKVPCSHTRVSLATHLSLILS